MSVEVPQSSSIDALDLPRSVEDLKSYLAAISFPVSRARLYELIRAGRVPFTRVGKIRTTARLIIQALTPAGQVG